MSQSRIDCVFFDIDGVLTNGTVLIDDKGSESKSLAFVDIDAIFRLKRAGLKLGFITGEATAFARYVQQRFAPEFFFSGCKDKRAAFQELEATGQVSAATTCFAGDSRKDMPLLNYVAHGCAPSTAEDLVCQAADHVFTALPGAGFVNAVVEYVLNAVTAPDFWSECLTERALMVQKIQRDALLKQNFERACNILCNAFREGKKLLICGNGGSAADAQHVAGELVGRFFKERPALYAEALTVDSSVLTCIANDYSYADVFSRQIEGKGLEGDVLLAISTSGQSENILRAVHQARHKKMKVIGLTGGKGPSPLEQLSDVTLCVPSVSTPRIQEGHLLLLHMMCEYIEQVLFEAH